MHEGVYVLSSCTLRSDSEELRRMVCSGCGENAIETERRIGLPMGAVGPSTVGVVRVSCERGLRGVTSWV